MRRLIGALVAALVMVAASTASVAAAQIAYGVTLRPSSVVSGAGEPDQGDPDGFGQAFVDLDPASGEVCFSSNISGIAEPIAARIHAGAEGSNGPAVVDLPTPTTGRSNGCVTVDPSLIEPVIADPTRFYVLVTTAEYPDGAIRGQLRLLFCTIHVTTADAGPEPTDVLFADEGETAAIFGRFAIGAQVLVTMHHDGVLVSSETHEVEQLLDTPEGHLSVEIELVDGDDGEWIITAEDPAVGDCRSSAAITVANTLPATPSQPLPDTALEPASTEPISLVGAAVLGLAAWAAFSFARAASRPAPAPIAGDVRRARSEGG